MRLDSPAPKDGSNNWIAVKAVGVSSNRTGIGALVTCVTEEKTQFNEVRSGGSYYSQNDLRVHFGLGKAAKVKTIEVRWPSGKVSKLSDVAVNQIVAIKED
ncbi:MAG: ASPIC/UnbV domain-containing protein [Blastocatellia bacterium]